MPTKLDLASTSWKAVRTTKPFVAHDWRRWGAARASRVLLNERVTSRNEFLAEAAGDTAVGRH